MFFITIEKGYEKSSHKVCIFCAETVKTCADVSEHIFYVSANVWLLIDVFQCFLKTASERYQRATASERKLRLIFFLC